MLACHYRGAFFEDYAHLEASSRSVGTMAFFFMTRLGQEAVLLFFVLSGFLVGGRIIEKVRGGTFSVSHYALDRSCRILIPLFSALLLVAVQWIVTGENFSWICLLGNMLSLQGVFVVPATEPLWSLSYEVWFYILAGGLVVAISKTRNSLWGGVLRYLHSSFSQSCNRFTSSFGLSGPLRIAGFLKNGTAGFCSFRLPLFFCSRFCCSRAANPHSKMHSLALRLA